MSDPFEEELFSAVEEKELCPHCQSDDLYTGYGLAYGGIGSYVVCLACDKLLAKHQDPRCEACGGAGTVEATPSFENAWGEHGLGSEQCPACKGEGAVDETETTEAKESI